MKRILMVAAALVFLFGMVVPAGAIVILDYDSDGIFEYTYNANHDYVSHEGNQYMDWSSIFTLYLPESYDSSLVTVFTITLHGSDADNTTQTIELYMNDGGDSSNYTDIGGKSIPNNNPFSIQWDVFQSGFDLSSLDGDSYFNAGYGCHFYHDSTTVHIEQSAVPLPAGIFLLGSGILGLLGIRRKING